MRHLTVQPVLQKLTKAGRWSAGRKVSVEVLRRTSNLPAEDRIRADILWMEPAHAGRGFSGPWAAKLLEGLVDLERVYELEPPHRPLPVRRTRAQVTLQSSGQGTEVCLQVGETRLSGQTIANRMLDETHGVIEREGVLHLFEIPQAARPLFEATAVYPAHIPDEAQGALLDVVTAISSTVEVKLPESMTGRAVGASATPILRFTPKGEGLRVEVRVRPLGTRDSERWQTFRRTALRVKVERAADWFGVGGGLEVDGDLLSLATLLSAVRAGQRYVQVGPHKFARIEADHAATARRLDEVTFERKGRLSAAKEAAEAQAAASKQRRAPR